MRQRIVVLSSSSSSDFRALCVSALSFSFRPLSPIRLSTFYFQFSTFHFPTRPLSRIAPIRRPEYPLPSYGGLGCESVRQGSGSALESLAQQFFALFFVFHFALRRTRSSSTRRSASNSIRSA